MCVSCFGFGFWRQISDFCTSQKPLCGQTPSLRPLPVPHNCDGLEIYQNIASCKNKLVNLKVHYCERYHAIGICFILFHRGIIAMAKMIMSEISWFLRCPSSSQIIAEYRLHVPMNKSLKMQILGFDGCGHQCKKRKQQWR